MHQVFESAMYDFNEFVFSKKKQRCFVFGYGDFCFLDRSNFY